MQKQVALNKSQFKVQFQKALGKEYGDVSYYMMIIYLYNYI